MSTRLVCHHLQFTLFIGPRRRDTYDMVEPEQALCDLVYLRYRWARELSEDRMQSLLDGYVSRGFDASLEKPYTMQQLSDLLLRMLQGKETRPQ